MSTEEKEQVNREYHTRWKHYAPSRIVSNALYTFQCISIPVRGLLAALEKPSMVIADNDITNSHRDRTHSDLSIIRGILEVS